MERHDVDTRLAGAYKAEYFADGDGGRVWNAAKKRVPKKRTPMRWAIPLAAAVAVVLTLGAAVPQARAAVVGLYFQTMSIFDYLGMDKTGRPDNTAAASLVQGNVPAILTVTAQPGGEWLKELGFSIDDVVYDGQYIYIRFTMDPKSATPFVVEPNIREGQTAQYKDYLGETLILNGIGEVAMLDMQPVYRDNGVVSDVVKFDARNINLTGTVRGTLPVDFFNCTETMRGGTVTGSQQLAGTIQAQFSFDASEGRKLDRVIDLSGQKHLLGKEAAVTYTIWGESAVSTIESRISLEGWSIAVDTIHVKPTGIDVRIHYYPPSNVPAFESQGITDRILPVFSGGGTDLEDLGYTTTSIGNEVITDCSIPMEYVGKFNTLTLSLCLPCHDGKYFIPGTSFDIDLDK